MIKGAVIWFVIYFSLKYFVEKYLLSLKISGQQLCSWVNITFLTCWVESGKKHLLSAEKRLMLCTTQNREISSANSFKFDKTLSGRSFRYIKKVMNQE